MKDEKNHFRRRSSKLPKEVEQIVREQDESFAKRLKDKSLERVHMLVFGRSLVILSLLLIQFAILFSVVYWMREYFAYFYAAMQVLALLTVVIVMNRSENPAFKLSWIILIMVLPVFGAALYVFVQGQFGYKLARLRSHVLNLECRPYLQQNTDYYAFLKSENAAVAGIAKFNYNTCGHPVYQHTRVKYFPLGEDKFEQLLIELNNAKKFIFLEYFIIKEGVMWESVLEILKRKVKEGVEVCVMYDGLNTFTSVPASYPKLLAFYGIKAKVYGPIHPILSSVQNNRDHRKIAVIDGRVAFTGGINLADEYINKQVRFGHWKDTAIMLEGEAVKSFTLMFLALWNYDEPLTPKKYEDYLLHQTVYVSIANDGYVLPYRDCPFDSYTVAKYLYINVLSLANDYVYIMTPYLILDNETQEALICAALRGVDVKLILPHVPDKKYAFWLAKTYMPKLLLNGVKLYEYEPGFVHAKVIVADDEMAIVGSSNIDYRSFYLHYECGAYLYHNSAIPLIREDVKETLLKCIEVNLNDLAKEPLIGRVIGRLLRLVAPLM